MQLSVIYHVQVALEGFSNSDTLTFCTRPSQTPIAFLYGRINTSGDVLGHQYDPNLWLQTGKLSPLILQANKYVNTSHPYIMHLNAMETATTV